MTVSKSSESGLHEEAEQVNKGHPITYLWALARSKRFVRDIFITEILEETLIIF